MEGKIKELEAQLAALNLSHERAIADHRAKIDALNAAAMAEAENLRQVLDHLLFPLHVCELALLSLEDVLPFGR